MTDIGDVRQGRKLTQEELIDDKNGSACGRRRHRGRQRRGRRRGRWCAIDGRIVEREGQRTALLKAIASDIDDEGR